MTTQEFKDLTGRTAIFTAPTGRKKYGTLRIVHIANLRDCNCPNFKTSYPWAWVGAEIEEASLEVKPEFLEEELNLIAEEY